MTGSLQIKNSTFYAVLNFRDHNNKRVQKWFNLHMPVRGNRRRAEAALQELINTYQGFSNIEPMNTLLSLFNQFEIMCQNRVTQRDRKPPHLTG